MALENGSIDLSKVVQGEDKLANKIDPTLDKLQDLVEKIEKVDGKAKKKIKISIDTSGVDPSKIDEVNTSLDVLNNQILSPRTKMKYFQSIENAENEVIRNWNNFVKAIRSGEISTDDMFSNEWATGVLRFANAFEALGGNIDNINPEISDFISSMRQIEKYTSAKGYNYTVNGFKDAFIEFSKLKNAGIYFDGFDTNISSESILSLKDVISSASESIFHDTSIIADSVDNINQLAKRGEEAVVSVEDLKARLDSLSRDKKEIFYDYELSGIGSIHEYDDLSDIEKYYKMLDELKSSQKDMLEWATYYNNKNVEVFNKSGVYNDNYSEWYNEYVQSYYRYSDEIGYVQNKLDDAIKNYSPSDVSSGIDKDTIIVLISLLSSLNDEIIKIREAFGTIDDESGITSLLSQIQEINTYLSTTSLEIKNLATSLSEIDFNFSINTGGGNKMAMTSDATREALKKQKEAYTQLYDSIIGNYNSTDLFKGNGNLFNKFIEYGDMIDPDNMSKSLYAYKEMTSILKELASIKGIDISDWTSLYEADAIQANKALSDVISGSKEASDAAERLSNIFGKGNTFNIDGEALSGQLERIIEQLKEIQDLMSKGLSFNDAVSGMNNTEISSESENLLSIEEAIQKITQAIQLKNEAFQLERQIVENAANSEVESLRQLSDILDNITLSVKQCSEVFEKLGSSSINLNILSDEDIEKLKNLSSDLNGLSSLSGFFEKVNSINIPDDLSSKINSLADAIEKLKNKFEGFPESGTTVFSQLNSLASQKDTLKDLAEVLNASSKKIDEAKDKISKKSKYDVAREYLSKNESSILDQTRSYFEGQGKELLSSEMSAAKNGLVEIKSLVKDIGDDGSVSYHNYVLTISEDTDLLVKSVSEGTVAAEKAGRAFERIFNADTGSDVLGGFSITEGTDDWKEITDVLEKFGIQAENVSKIVRNIRRDSDGNFLESFNVTTKDGSTRTIGRSSQSILSGKDEIFNISDIENKYNSLFKKLRTAKLNLAKNENDEFAIVDIAKSESEISELEKLIENLKGKMLSEDDYKNIIDQGAKYRNSITKDVDAALEKKNKPKATPKSSNKPKVDVNKQRENEVDDYVRDLERLKKAEQSFAKNGGDQNKAIIESLTKSLSESKNKISGYLDQLSDEYKNKFSKIAEGIISDIAKINPDNPLVSDDQKYRAKVLSDNEKAANSYNNLANNAEKYYKLKNKQSMGGKLSENDTSFLADFEKQINLANEAMFGSSSAANAYTANLNGVKSEIEDVISAQINYLESMNKAQKETRENYAAGKNDSINKIIEGLDSESNRPNAYAEQLEKIKIKFEEIKDITANGIVSDDAFGDYAKQIKEIETMISEIKKGGEYRYARSEDINALDAKITKWSNTNTVAAKKYKSEIAALTDKLHEAGLTSAELDKIKVAFDEISNSAVKAGITGQSFGDRVKSKFKELASYLMSFASFYDIINIGRQAIDIITELDDALTEMRKVSEEPLSVLKSYQKETFNTAADIGTTSAQLQQSTADFMRLGESLNEAKESAADATILMNVSEFESIDDATNSLIAMSQAYDELGKMDVIDKLNNIGNNFSISTDGLATALQKSAAALKTAGNDMDEAIALVTAGNAIVQDPDSVGSGVRTIALRIQGTELAKQELAELGEDVDDYVVQTASKLNAKVKELTKSAGNAFKGVSLLDENGNYRSTYEILQDIADVYNEIVDADKKNGTNRMQGLLELLAGKNRSNIAASILQNADMLRSVYETSMNSAGSAQAELDKYLDSVSGKMSKLQNQLQELASVSINTDDFKMLIDLGTQLLSLITDLVDNFGLLNIAAGAIGGVLSTKKGLGRIFVVYDAPFYKAA